MAKQKQFDFGWSSQSGILLRDFEQYVLLPCKQLSEARKLYETRNRGITFFEFLAELVRLGLNVQKQLDKLKDETPEGSELLPK